MPISVCNSFGTLRALHSGVDSLSHKCSPMREISTSFPQFEHLIVGKNVDSRGRAMICRSGLAGQNCEANGVISWMVLFLGDSRHRV